MFNTVGLWEMFERKWGSALSQERFPPPFWVGGSGTDEELNCSAWVWSWLSSPWDNEMTINPKAVATHSVTPLRSCKWGRKRRENYGQERNAKAPLWDLHLIWHTNSHRWEPVKKHKRMNVWEHTCMTTHY